MKNIFYIIALLVTLGAAFLSWDVNKKFQAEHALINTKYTNEETQESFDVGLVELNDRYEATIKQTEDDLKAEKDQLEAAKKELAERNAAIEVAQSNERTLSRTLGETEGTLEEQKVKLDALDKAIAEAGEALKGEGDVNLDNLPDKIKELDDQRKALIDQQEELTQLVDGAEKNLGKNRDEVGRLADRKTERDSRIRHNSMEASVTAVNYEWGFVIVGAGSKSGFTPQTTVLVKRDGRVLGQLKPSSIEPNQTIFEIDFGSMAPGVRIRPGDRVFVAQPRT